MAEAALTEDDARELSESLGQIGGGWWRQVARYIQIGIPQKLGMTAREWGQKYHGYMSLPIEERREAVAELTEQGMSSPEIADVLGVNEKTVDRDRAATEGTNVPAGPGDPTESEATEGTNVPDEQPQFLTGDQLDLTDDAANQTLDEIDPDGAEQQRQADLVAAWSKSHAALAKKVADLNSFPIEDVATLLDETGRLNAQTGVDLLRNYCKRMEATLRASSGLHVVAGSQR